MRIRSVGNRDFECMKLQRNVIIEFLELVKDFNIFETLCLMDQVIPYVKTNLDKSIIIDMLMF